MSKLQGSAKVSQEEHHHAPELNKASSFARFFFLKTIFAILLSLLLIVGGLMGASTMVKEGNPDINVAISLCEALRDRDN